MSNTQKLEKIGTSKSGFEKFLKGSGVTVDIDNLSEIDFYTCLDKFFEFNRKKLLKLKENIDKEKEENKQKWLELNKKIAFEEKNLKEELEQKRLEFENKLKEQEIEHKKKLDQQELELQKKLIEEKEQFLAKAKREFEAYWNKKIEELSKKEQELNDKEMLLKEQQDRLMQQQDTFEASKEKELNELKIRLEEREQEFEHNLKEKELQRVQEIEQKIKELYNQKEQGIKQKEQELTKLQFKLEGLKQSLAVQESEIRLEKENIPKKVDELIKEKIESYERKIEILEDEVGRLREEKDEYFEELNAYENNIDKDLVNELNEKKEEISKLNEKLEKIKDEKNQELLTLEKNLNELNKELNTLREENQSFRVQIEDIERLNSQLRIQDEKLKELDLIKGENENLRTKLETIYFTGKEKEERVKVLENQIHNECDKDKNIHPLGEQIEISNEIEYLENIANYMKEYGVEYPKRLLYAFHTALKSADFSPLTVLSGVSGTGKSELPKLYAYFGGFNFLAEAVQPTWDSPEALIGHYNMLESKFDATNILKFLLQTSKTKDEYKYGWNECMNMILLDEMNLAHIELYFAEFLSKFEQRRGSKDVNIDIKIGTGMNYPIPLDINLLWIGTMNEDETTKSLSDKVLDRAYSINFPRPNELTRRTKIKKKDEIKKFEYLHRDIWNSWIKKDDIFIDDKKEILEKFRTLTNEINQELGQTGRAIGHRVWQSMEFYIQNHPKVLSSLDNKDEFEKYAKLAYEEQLVQKIMPKLRGIEVHGKEKIVLDNIKEKLNQNNFKIEEDFEIAMNNPYGQFIWSSANYLNEDI